MVEHMGEVHRSSVEILYVAQGPTTPENAYKPIALLLLSYRLLLQQLCLHIYLFPPYPPINSDKILFVRMCLSLKNYP